MSAGCDAGNDNSTYPSDLGIVGARRRAGEIQQRAVTALRTLGPSAEGLEWLSEFILSRSY
jgi:farnesyl diphosphate synthase/geranylgeranyl diphosphate synthase type II